MKINDLQLRGINMPKIIIVNGLKCIYDETVLETIYNEEDSTIRMTKNDWENFKKELKE